MVTKDSKKFNERLQAVHETHTHSLEEMRKEMEEQLEVIRNEKEKFRKLCATHGLLEEEGNEN